MVEMAPEESENLGLFLALSLTSWVTGKVACRINKYDKMNMGPEW